MANCSNAYGQVQITMDNAEDMVKLINKALGGGYRTEIDESEIENNEKDYIYATFWGIGRWAYECNCRYFWNWLKNGAEETGYKDLFDKIKGKDFQIIFDFNDEEGGCNVLYDMTYIIKHKAGVDGVDGSVLSYTDYEYTPENLVKLGVYDNINDAKEALSL